ncbi:MAG: cbb3-type cytochrome c oxidase subunit I [Firmicutes bacterium]|nr:cbb3-type cytochrome c oxidase subunit I [Bacillota bacterium]
MGAQHTGEKEESAPQHRPSLPPVLRGMVWGGIAFALLNFFVIAIQRPEYGALVSEVSVSVGMGGALIGWLLGIGGYETWLLPWFGRPAAWREPEGWQRYFSFSTDHKVIGIQYLITATGTFLVAGMVAMAMRYNLMTPSLNLFPTSVAYESAVSIHGTLMLFAVSVVAIVGGFGNYFVPLMIGAKDMVFPRLNGISYWLIPFGVLTILLSPLLGGFVTGWTGYEPLAARSPSGQIFYYIGVFTLGLSSLLTAVNVIATTVFLRAPGVTWGRLPMFVWAMLVTSLLNLYWVPSIGTTFILGLLDRLVPTDFFGQGGLPLAWQSLFWLFGHPEVYIIMLPAWGIWLEVLPVFARKTLFAQRWALIGFIVIMLMSNLVWAHHMFTDMGNAEMIPFMLFTELISIPTGFMYLVALGTMWRSRIRLTTPMILVLMSLFNFLIGGLSGVFLADGPVNLAVHDSYFVVAHFHYTIIGGMVFAWLAGMYYWLPKITGHAINEVWGKINAVAIFIGFNATFGQMFLAGMHGMNRRIALYPAYLAHQNLWISISAFVLGAAFASTMVNFGIAWVRGRQVGANPWDAKTLEWKTASPPPKENFEEIPVVTEGFYGYGNAGAEPEIFVPRVAVAADPPAPPTGVSG